MYEKEYDMVFVPFTTKMTSLEQLFYDTLMLEIEKYLLITKQWIQTQDGLEYLHTTTKSSNKNLQSLLQQHHINTSKLHTILLTQYNTGISYARKSINQPRNITKTSHRQSINILLKGVDKIISRFDKTIRKDILYFIKNMKGEKTKTILHKLKDWVKNNFTTPISAKVRSEMIARTEMNRSFTNGVLQTYANYGLNSFDIVNYNDIGICDTCIELIQNNPYTLEEVMRLIPAHPNCKCLCVIAHTLTEIPLKEIENPIIINMFKLA